jgi:hypothetical protein
VNRWEYTESSIPNMPGCVPSKREILAELGAEGWELVAVTGGSYVYTYYFKRPLRSAAPTFTQADGFEVYER